MGFNLSNAAGAAATGVADVATTFAKTEIAKRASMDIEQLRASIQSERDARKNEFSAGENAKQREFTSGENVANRDFTKGENAANRTHAEGLQRTSLEHAAEQGNLNRQVQREGQGIQARQVAVLEQGAALDREIKQITLNNAKDLEKMRAEYNAEQDPDKRARINDNISVLTGKTNENYLPVPLKDEMGNVTGYKIFDKRRGNFVDESRGAGAKAGNDPLGIRGSLPGAKAKPDEKTDAPKPAGLIASEMAAGSGIPGAAPLNPEAQQSFDADAKAMTPQALIAKYKAVFPSLSGQQQLKYYEAEKNLPKRVPGFA